MMGHMGIVVTFSNQCCQLSALWLLLVTFQHFVLKKNLSDTDLSYEHL